MKTKPRVSPSTNCLLPSFTQRGESRTISDSKKTAGLPRSNPQPGIGFAPRHEDRIEIGIQSVGRHTSISLLLDRVGTAPSTRVVAGFTGLFRMAGR